MIKKICLALFALLLIVEITTAQKVTRKGVTSNAPVKKNIQRQPATPAYTAEQLAGKWIEVNRTNKAKENVPIKDTLYLHFANREKVVTREGNNPNLTGAYTIEADNELVAAADVFTILSLDKKNMVLDNQDLFIHTFNKIETFWFESVGYDSVVQESFTTPIEVSVDQLVGKWNVYRRQAKPGSVVLPKQLVKRLEISDSLISTGKGGSITLYNDDETMEYPCFVQMAATEMVITTTNASLSFFIYKVNNKELVFGKANEILYYAKKAE